MTDWVVRLSGPENSGNIKDWLQYLAIERYNATGLRDLSWEKLEHQQVLGKTLAVAWSISDDQIGELEELSEAMPLELQVSFDDYSVAEKFHAEVSQNPSLRAEVGACETKDWNEEWKRGFVPIELKNARVWIFPDWITPELQPADSAVVRIRPAQGFGTGTHPSTAMCLEFVHQLASKNLSKVLDFGCGSGILGITFQKKKPDSKVSYFDIDPSALENARENLELNEISSRSYELLPPGSALPCQQDLILANVLLDVLRQSCSSYAESLNAEGFLVVSGLLTEQVEDFMASAVKHFSLLDELRSEGWSALLLQKRPL